MPPGPHTREVPVGPPTSEHGEASALGDSELDMLLGLMPDPGLVVDATGTVLAGNAGIEQLFGYEPGELVGERIEVLVPERLRHAHRERRSAFVDAPRARQMGEGLDLYGRRKDGTELPIDVSLAPIRTAAGLRVMAAVRDVSERRSAESARAQLATIVQSSRDAIVSTTLQGAITSWNPGAEALFGHTAEAATRLHVSDLVPPGRSEEFEQMLGEAMEGHPSAPLDTRWRRRDGSEIDVAISISPVRAAGGDLIGFAAFVRDITERKQAEAELRRLFLEEQRRERWQSAMAEVRLMMLSDRPAGDILQVLCDRVVEALEAEQVVVVEGGGPAVVASSTATGRPPGAALDPAALARATESGKLEVVEGERCMLTAPFRSGHHAGALVVVRRPGAQALDAIDERTAEGFAEQAGLVLQLAQARDDQEQLMLVADRERIARDLHDLVIQRLFAVGMGLQAATRLLRDEQAAARINAAVDDLDTTIRDIRTVIFELEPSTAAALKGLRAEVLELAVRARASLGFDPVVHFEGPIDSGVPEGVALHLRAALQEALSNVARHAHATRVEVVLSVGDDVALTVSDDGDGIGDLTRTSGLSNLRQRAESLGGTTDLANRPGGGARLVWRVPR